MYRCHFTFGGHIVAGEDLLATTLDQAIAEAQAMLVEKPAVDHPTGFEIWIRSTLVYQGA